ncbi:MAG: hypothetical protein V1761_02065 [bacterium]
MVNRQRILLMFILPLLCLSFLGCETVTTTTTGRDYADFDYLEDYDEVFNRNAGTYIVYIYSTDCYNCAQFKDEILEFAATFTDRTIFFFNVSNATSSLQTAYLDMIGQTAVRTPSLVLIKNNAFDKTVASRYYFEGAPIIRSLLNDLENQSYLYWE